MSFEDPKALQKICSKLIGLRAFDRFEAVEKKVAKLGSAELDAIVEAQRAMLDIERIAVEHGIPDEVRPAIWWMRGPFPGNFGDILSPYLIWKLFGVLPRWVPTRNAEGLCIGSIIKLAGPATKVWGSGTPRSGDPLNPDAIYTAVRGPMTRDAVLRSGGKVDEIYGDPAILLPEVYNPDVTQDTDIGIIPHVLQLEEFQQKFAASPVPGVKIISLLTGAFTGIENVIREIKSCRRIITTSLHGLIVAQAYGIPAQSLRFGVPGEAKDSFKATDYKMSVGLDHPPLVISKKYIEFDWLNDIDAVLPPDKIDSETLKAVFPFHRH